MTKYLFFRIDWR